MKASLDKGRFGPWALVTGVRRNWVRIHAAIGVGDQRSAGGQATRMLADWDAPSHRSLVFQYHVLLWTSHKRIHSGLAERDPRSRHRPL